MFLFMNEELNLFYNSTKKEFGSIGSATRFETKDESLERWVKGIWIEEDQLNSSFKDYYETAGDLTFGVRDNLTDLFHLMFSIHGDDFVEKLNETIDGAISVFNEEQNKIILHYSDIQNIKERN